MTNNNDDDDNEDKLNKALGIESSNTIPLLYDSNIIDNIVGSMNDDSAMQDFIFARANVHEVVENGKDAIEKLSEIANQSQNPRAFEVLAKLMDSVTNASEKLLDLQKKIKEMQKAAEPNNPKGQTINQLFVGSTAELQKMIENIRNK
jgi:hypothetical protein